MRDLWCYVIIFLDQSCIIDYIVDSTWYHVYDILRWFFSEDWLAFTTQCKLKLTGLNLWFLHISEAYNVDEMFNCVFVCRTVRSLSLEGCSLLTTEGLELVLLSWTELDMLKVISCNNVRDSEITPELATLFSDLKELKWRPDSRSLLSANLTGTGIGEKGDRYLRS